MRFFSFCALMRALPLPALLGAAAPLPAALPAAPPSHVVLVIEENHGYDEIIGSSAAPYMNALAKSGALMTQSFAVTHPSEPNYLELFSGSTQGVTDDSCPHAFSAPNLGSQLLAAGKTFTGYSEDLPYAGYTGCGSAAYAYKHNPWVMFPAIPASSNQPFSAFPQGHFQDLPLVSIVIPNLNDDMHDGTIQGADSWLQANLDGYVQWARNNNSLLILTFDEDDNGPDNHITSNHAIQAAFAPTAPGGKVISIDFVGSRTSPMAATEVAGVLPRAHWNSARGAASTAALPLVDETGAATGATVTWWASRIRHLRETEDPTGDRHMMRGY